ncbi:MAG: hypothetical protein HXS41_13675 [Theionarchaea archaeon]|nr:hypothetical protein [Theionarchaea archaeon]MBU7001747.1 hypothetical protein [Theionarchaea archaeon]MBU7022100.1 hypothetical protein [Theionarchaea archaeon]MBU7035663.1 hypothetical protein [Theionarchaea archaeon]MBU7040858.1 hypothetical protein [Theionarchaea archaeon]
MKINLQKIKSAAFSIFWILLIASLWYLWLIGFQHLIPIGHSTFVTLLGVFIGMISGFSPRRALIVCFAGFSIITVLIGIIFPMIFYDLVFSSVFCALFGMTGAIIRRIVTQKKKEELYLNSWEWIVLIGGTSLLVDYNFIGCAYTQLLTYDRLSTFLRLVILGSVGLFFLGVYAGAFHERDNSSSAKSLVTFSSAGHTIYILYKSYTYVIGHMSSRAFLLVFPIILTFISVFFIGTKTGSWCRASRRKMGYSSGMGVL